MKCPKCGYISFDYNQICPKCSKDISTEQVKMNLPPFRPVPLSLLGALTGEASESSVGIQIDTSSIEEVSEEVEEVLDVSSDLETGEIAFDDLQELDKSLESEATEEREQPGESGIVAEESPSDFEFEGVDSQEISLETGEISLKEPESALPIFEKEDEEEISLDLEDLSIETPEPEKEAVMESASEEGELTIDLDDFDLSLDDSGPAGAAETEKTDVESDELAIDLDSFDLDVEDTAIDEEKDEIELDLDDLKINETGELEIDTDAKSAGEEEKPLTTVELSLDEPPTVEEISQDLPDEKEEMTIDLEDISLDGQAISDSTDSGDEELSLDLDDLDLELDLEEPDDKSS